MITKNKKINIIAEIGVNHNGKINLAKNLSDMQNILEQILLSFKIEGSKFSY